VIGRREVITLLGGAAAAWPRGAAVQKEKIPRIGFLVAASEAGFASRIEAVRAGLRDLGYIEGRNITYVYRWADEYYDRLPALADELVRAISTSCWLTARPAPAQQRMPRRSSPSSWRTAAMTSLRV
jgi:hypothetical protein